MCAWRGSRSSEAIAAVWKYTSIDFTTPNPCCKMSWTIGSDKKPDLHCRGVGSWWEFTASSGKAWRVSWPSAENSRQGGRYHSGSSSPEVYYEKEFAQDEKKKVDYKRLPVSQKKNPFTGRVGERANNMKRGYNVSLNDIERQPAKQPKLAHIKNANSSAEAQVNINRSVNVNNSNGSNSNANQTVKASTPYTPNTTTCKWINRELIRKRGTAFSRFRQWRPCQDRVGIMGKQIADLEGKLKTLNFCLKKTEDLKDKVSVEALVTAVVKF